MTRVLICLPFLLFFALLYPRGSEPEPAPHTDTRAHTRLRTEWLGALAASPDAGFPGALPWSGLFQVTNNDPTQTDPLPSPDILTFMQMCIERYKKEVKEYSCILYKHERVGNTPERDGRLLPPETVKAEFRENQFSVHMKWIKGSPGLGTTEVLFVKGENNDNIVLKTFFVVYQKSLKDPLVQGSGRYGILEFGLQKGIERTVHDWKIAREKGLLQIRYEGVYQVPKAGNRLCYKIHRWGYPDPEGIADVDLYIDTEYWLQVGTILRGQRGQLVGEYFFRDIDLHPNFQPNHFTPALLQKK
jgi:hypothetical protein